MEHQFKEQELGQCLELIIDHRGKTPKKLGSDWVNQGIPTISAKQVNGGRLVATDQIRFVTYDVYRRWMKEDVKRGDCFLVSEGATLGECMYWDEEFPIVLSQRLFCLRSNPSILYPRFLYAYMTSFEFQSEVVGRATGTSVDGLRQTEVLKLRIKLPELKVQKFVGDVIYHLNKKIELNRKMNETLEAMARSLFKSWFVDFDPVRAKMDGRQPIGMDAETAKLFSDKFVESELGLIPEGWEIGSLGDLVDLIKSPIKPTSDKDHLRYVALDDMPQKSIDLSKFRLGSEVNSSIISFDDGDILFGSMRPYFHKVGLAQFDGITRTTTFVLRPRNDCYRHYTLMQFFSDEVVEFSTVASVGTTIPYVKWESLSPYKVVIPSVEVLLAFQNLCQPMTHELKVHGHQSRTLANLRDTLLPKLLSGELSVSTL